MDHVLHGLNAAQRAAVTSPASVIQILAPPGSGKTKTLTSRVAYLLLHYGYRPWNIICLTFTIKSSREMKDRIAKLLGNGTEAKIILGTFHSVCRRYLVSYGHLIGIHKGFGIADSSDTLAMIKRIVQRFDLKIEPKVAQSRISSSKARGISFRELALDALKGKNVDKQGFLTIFEAYEQQLMASNLLDYDDLLLRCADLLRQHPTCVSNVEVVLIDEFQDTNLVQFDLMTLFAAKMKRITTVGDPDQSIYGWRSAEVKNLEKMQSQYPDTLVIHLEENYRSSGAILLAAREVIEQDESRPSKLMLPTHCPGSIPVLRILPSAEVEALWIVTEIKRAVGMTGALLTCSDFSILLRSAYLSRHIESALGKAGIPYRMVGGQKFFDRVEIKILLDYLRVISQPDNNDALARIINIPSRNVGTVTIKALLEEAETKSSSLWKLVRDAVLGSIVPKTKILKRAEQGLGVLINIILTARKKLLDSANPSSPDQLLLYLLDKLKFQEHLERTYENDHEARWANVQELLIQTSDVSATNTNHPSKEGQDYDSLPTIEGLEQENGSLAEESLSRFLANVALATEIQREDEKQSAERPQKLVTISTIHAAKGLEWPVVFIPSVYAGSIPHSRAEDTDEERRLLYVAMTRAQVLLYTSCPILNSQKEETRLSPFLSSKKLAPHLINKGPTIDFGIVQDISRILRRICPSEKEICDGRMKLESTGDDMWPVSREKHPETVQAKWDEWNSSSSEPNQHNSKRRKIIDRDENNRLRSYRHGPDHNDISIASSVRFPTTMQNASSFSVSAIKGFVSASSHLHHLSNNSQDESLATGLREPSMPTRESQQQESSIKYAKLRVKAEGLGSLSKFWYKGLEHVDDARAGTRKTPKSASIPSNVRRNDDIRNDAWNGAQPRDTPIKCSISKTAIESIVVPTPAVGTNALHSRTSLSVIPQALADHRIHRISKTTQNFLPAMENQSSKQYVFLSSSPPPLDDDEVRAEGSIDENMTSAIGDSFSETVTNAGRTRPATTLHTTSIAEVQASSKNAKKTLGLRRGMTGWIARPNQGFTVPRMPRMPRVD